MRKINLLLVVLFLTFITGCDNKTEKNGQEIASSISQKNVDNNKTKLKRYLVKSAIIKYKTTISGNIMGATIIGSGTEELYFKDWGAIELKKTDNKKVTKMDIFGQKKTDVTEEHTIIKLDNGKSYSVNTKNKVIYLRRDPAMEMMKTFNGGDVVNPGEKMLESIGGKKIGKEDVLGYNCDIWEITGGKQWIYKGLPLKLKMTVMGITSTTETVSAKFDISVPDKYLKLPDYPIKKEMGYQNDKEYALNEQKMRNNAQKINKMTFVEYKKMVLKEDPNASEEELKKGYKIMKKMAKNLSK